MYGRWSCEWSCWSWCRVVGDGHDEVSFVGHKSVWLEAKNEHASVQDDSVVLAWTEEEMLEVERTGNHLAASKASAVLAIFMSQLAEND